MKTRTIAAILTGLIAVAMLGSLVLPKGEAVLKARLSWKPKTYTLDATGVPALWNVTIVGIDPTLIDPASIKAVGETYGTPISPDYTEVSLAGRDDFIAGFKGTYMRNLIWQIVLYHDFLAIPGRHKLNIKVYGTLFDTTPFEGVKPITVIISEPPPAPPTP